MVQKQAAEDDVIVLREGIVKGIGLEEPGAKAPLLGAAGRDGHRLRAEVGAVNLYGEPFSASPFRQGGGVVPTATGQIQNPQRAAAALSGQRTDRSEQGTDGSAEGVDPAQTLQGLAVGDRIDAGLVHPLGLPVPLGQGREKHQAKTRWSGLRSLQKTVMGKSVGPSDDAKALQEDLGKPLRRNHELLNTAAFLEALPAFLSPDQASQQQLPDLLETLRAITALADP